MTESVGSRPGNNSLSKTRRTTAPVCISTSISLLPSCLSFLHSLPPAVSPPASSPADPCLPFANSVHLRTQEYHHACRWVSVTSARISIYVCGATTLPQGCVRVSRVDRPTRRHVGEPRRYAAGCDAHAGAATAAHPNHKRRPFSPTQFVRRPSSSLV